mmetsp:Transcript_32708/g.75663  ORF Transcript_32708/g.75663 Transcript_32708/m.75663 type:complete len:209 (+) Transcript_32708:53-679(+)|eukprot:CAMPEP_0119515562 /NCGR_PEP_ID=MMETSP1344-20130328/33011_1 /TAXON_ID=236787 /ORGANISM="Florenciella parvula, Strain CCMP2471" /LENGTH=208 /DNA_ID=CAMNT_0007552977 /DNA_START=96 /DNA_END=722 /DNA_ORIENTATION=-
MKFTAIILALVASTAVAWQPMGVGAPRRAARTAVSMKQRTRLEAERELRAAVKAGKSKGKAGEKVGGFVIPVDAVCVDDVVGTQASAATKLRCAAALREMGRPLPLVYRPELSDEEKAQKQKIREYSTYGSLAAGLFLVANIAETALNAQFNLWPDLKQEWNYSGNNDAICAKLKIDKPSEYDSYALCSETNLKAIKPRSIPKPKGVE